jgi:hypothetical protein
LGHSLNPSLGALAASPANQQIKEKQMFWGPRQSNSVVSNLVRQTAFVTGGLVIRHWRGRGVDGAELIWDQQGGLL